MLLFLLTGLIVNWLWNWKELQLFENLFATERKVGLRYTGRPFPNNNGKIEEKIWK